MSIRVIVSIIISISISILINKYRRRKEGMVIERVERFDLRRG